MITLCSTATHFPVSTCYTAPELLADLHWIPKTTSVEGLFTCFPYSLGLVIQAKVELNFVCVLFNNVPHPKNEITASQSMQIAFSLMQYNSG